MHDFCIGRLDPNHENSIGKAEMKDYKQRR